MLNIVNKLFKSLGSNSLKKYSSTVEKINNLEKEISSLNDVQIKQKTSYFKDFLSKELIQAKDYKIRMKWFDGVWSRFKPEIGQDKRGVTGVDKKELIAVGKKITEIPKNFNIHKTLEKLLENARITCWENDICKNNLDKINAKTKTVKVPR